MGGYSLCIGIRGLSYAIKAKRSSFASTYAYIGGHGRSAIEPHLGTI